MPSSYEVRQEAKARGSRNALDIPSNVVTKPQFQLSKFLMVVEVDMRGDQEWNSAAADLTADFMQLFLGMFDQLRAG
jgi:hypothetical protein